MSFWLTCSRSFLVSKAAFVSVIIDLHVVMTSHVHKSSSHPVSSPSKAASVQFATVGLSSESAAATWSALQRAIQEIYRGHSSKLRFEELYRHAYTLVLHKHGQMLYDGVQTLITAHIHDVRRRIASDTNTVNAIATAYATHLQHQTMIRDILMYLDKAFARHAKTNPVFDLSQLIWRNELLLDPTLHARWTSQVQSLIEDDRDGRCDRTERDVVKYFLLMLLQVNLYKVELYQRDFEAPFLQRTSHFFAAEAQSVLAEQDVSGYFNAHRQTH